MTESEGLRRQRALTAAGGRRDRAKDPIPAPPPQPEDGLAAPARYWAATAIWLAMAMATIDSTIANIALPTIARDVGATADASIWVVNAYQVGITMVLLPVAMLGEIIGYRRVYMVGLGLFAAASAGCVLAHGLAGLAAFRFLQGLGAACVMAINGALLRLTYPKAALGQGIGYSVLVVAITSAAGPSVAAAILAVASWRWLFAINIPIGLLSLAIGHCFLPPPRGTGARFDVRAAVLNALAFGALFLASSDVAHGTASPRTALEALVGAAASALLIRRSLGQKTPLVPLDLMRIPILRLSYATSACSFAAMIIAGVSLPFILQERFGFSRVQTGLLMTPLPLGIAVASIAGGRLPARLHAGLIGGIGLGTLGLGLLLLTAQASAAPVFFIPALTLCGVGFGLFQTPNNRTMLSQAPHERSGAAGGMLATSRLVGQMAGALLVALLFRMVGPAETAPLMLAAGLAFIAAAVSFTRITAR